MAHLSCKCFVIDNSCHRVCKCANASGLVTNPVTPSFTRSRMLFLFTTMQGSALGLRFKDSHGLILCFYWR